ncbi:MAG TPA: NAD-binding protein [Thermoanaerobaculia bacterium]|nr:NAD-binding protein [Thermoanaerobaculia bacterium]
MTRSQRRLVGLLLALPLLLVATSLGYMAGMRHLEGSPRGFWDSLEWAAESLTTTGYGADDRWRHPAMVLFVVLVQWVGVFFVFLVFPVYLIPFLEERFEAQLPRRAPPLTGHVVVYRYGPAVESAVELLAERGVPVLVAESDEASARRLVERGIPVVFARGEEELLSVVRLEHARAVIGNGRDEENAALVLGARQRGFEGEVVALVEEPMHRKPMALAGASAVYTPRHILAAALAARASDRISPRLAGVQQLGDLQVREVRVHAESALAGHTLAAAQLGARTGAIALGQWVGGRLVAPLVAETRLEPRGILVAVGSEPNLERLQALCAGPAGTRRDGPFVVAGFGEVGRKVRQLLTDAGEPVWAVDRHPVPGVDLVANVLAPEVLQREELRGARAVILALNSDELTLLATVVMQDVVPEAPVIARVNEHANIEKIHRAGADFALSLSQVSGQMLARRLLGEEALSLDPRLKVVKLSADGIAGRALADLGLRERTGASVVAVERAGALLVDLEPGFRFAAGDALFLFGSDADVRSVRDLG